MLCNTGVDLAVNYTFVVFGGVETWRIVGGHLGYNGTVPGKVVVWVSWWARELSQSD